MTKYIARFSMISELSEADFQELHKNEFYYRNAHNWFAVSQKFLWDKFHKGLWDNSVNEKQKSVKIQEFEIRVKSIMKRNNIFSWHKSKYIDDNTGKFFIGESEKTVFEKEYSGANWSISEVQKVDRLVRDNGIIIERGIKSSTELQNLN